MDIMTIVGIVCLVAGFVLVGIEIAIPGFGFFGITGIAALVAGVFFTTDGVRQAIMLTIIIIVILGIMFTVMITVFTHKKKLPFVLDEEAKADAGHLDSTDLEYLVGRKGKAVTDLRPEGRGDFDGVEFTVRSKEGYIDKGESVCIVQVKGKALYVVKSSKAKELFCP